MVVATLQLLYRVFNGCGKRHSYRKFIDAHACAFCVLVFHVLQSDLSTIKWYVGELCRGQLNRK